MNNKFLILLASVATIVLCPDFAAAQGFSVIVNSANPVASLPAADVSKLFLRKTPKWTNGQPVQPVDMVESSAARKAFSKAILGMDVPSVKSYWQEMVFSGKADAPVEKASDADVIAFVKSHPNAIGYVGAGAALGEVKVVSIK